MCLKECHQYAATVFITIILCIMLHILYTPSFRHCGGGGKRCTNYNVIFQHPVALYRSVSRAFVPSVCDVVHSFSYSFIGHYMFRPNRPSSGVQVIMVKDSAAHCNAVFFLPIVVASGYFGYVDYQ
jgi:hypothetical protein